MSDIGPGDARYEDLSVRASNLRFRPRPVRFEVPDSTEQVVAAVRRAVEAGERIAVRSSGHCYENFISAEPVQVVIDVAGLDSVGFDPERNAFAVGAGAGLLSVYRKLFYGWGVTIPGGACGSVAVGGHVQGGGYGPLSRLLGLTVDYVEAVEVVVVDAAGRVRVIVAGRDPDDPQHDLWWAHTGGGGGNFGVVTRYWFRAREPVSAAPGDLLPRPPARMISSQVIWSWSDLDGEDFARILRNHGEWHEHHSEVGSPFAALFGGLVVFGRQEGADPGVACISFVQIDAMVPAAAELLVAYLEAIGAGVGSGLVLPSVESPWLALTARNARIQDTEEMRIKIKSAVLRQRFSDQQIARLFDWFGSPDPDRGGASLSLQSYGCAVNSVEAAATAVAHRDSIFQALFYATWEHPEEDEARIGWLRRCYQDLYRETGGVPLPDQANSGCFINFPDRDLADPEWNTSGVPWHQLYYRANYPRLQQVKAAADPGGIFRHALSVEPFSGTEPVTAPPIQEMIA